ncbi:MAG: beta-lactamase family protein [Gammaproteobacteria bacterium]|nr:beta-lactamase family protein [Gammaproteobacteria bacterium]
MQLVAQPLRWAIALTLLVAIGQGSLAEATNSTDDHFEAYLDGLVSAQFSDYKLAGMSFALVRDGEITLTKGYGHADLATHEPVDPARHLFRPGSVSKLFTWTAVMQLVEQGKISLHEDVSKYVQQFDIPNEFNTPLTLTHIMTHAPGLEDGAAGFLFVDAPSEITSLAQALATHIPTQVRAPGTYSSYSNWATALAGLVVANVSGMSFEDYVQENIFTPLNMQHSTFDEPLPAHLLADMSIGYIEKQGALEPFGFEYIKNFGPAGALSASANDMAVFMLAHLNHGSYAGAQILQPETTRLMHSNLFSHHEKVSAMAHGFYETRRNANRFIGHAGATVVFHSQLLIDPDNNFGFYLSFNAADGGQARSAIVNGIIDYFYPLEMLQHPTMPPLTLPGSAARIAKIVGAYRLNRRSHTRLEAIAGLAGDLTIVPAGGGAIELPVPNIGGKFVEVEPFVFDQVGRQGRLVFEVNDAGEVEHGFMASLPTMVMDKLSFSERASSHQAIILLTLLASLFVIINTTRNRQQSLSGAAKNARRSITAAATFNLLFAMALAAAMLGTDIDRLIFDFPPSGTTFALLLAVLASVCTFVALLLLVPVWRAEDCGIWARIRYTYVTTVFVLFVLVLHFWNMLGWRY